MIQKIPNENIDPEILSIGGVKIPRGQRTSVHIEAAALYDYTKLNIPVEVIRGKKPGPVMFISAAVHGDELNGVEIIRRLLRKKFLSKIKGTLIAVPVVNVFGFNNKKRYLPDGRDLNRSFPGNSKGSLASRLANVFLKEVVSKCSYGIDLHTGAMHRTNLPQIRACLDDPITRDLAEGFGVPVVIDSSLRDGSLREAARKRQVNILLYEGGEALRFEENVIRTGLRGCMSVMKKIGMMDSLASSRMANPAKIFVAKSSYWIRAPRSGAFIATKKIGDFVTAGTAIATISDPFGRESQIVLADEDGVLIGANLLPLVNQGDAMFHIAVYGKSIGKVKRALEYFEI